MKRRRFLQKAGAAGLLLGTGVIPLEAMAKPEILKLTILHTNDVHSRIEPFPEDGSRRAGRGGAGRRAALIKQIRREEKNVLLLDCGDIFQGTPYFNFFKGELEFKLMSEMGYDAATIGNHDFDVGIDGLVKQLPLANFPFLIGNYDFSDTAMNGRSQAYKIFQKQDIRIGVFGLGIELDGLVPSELYGPTRYLDPLEKGQYYASLLRKEERCDYVICLSHLGYKYDTDKVSDVVLARSTEDIDLILGGHTHTFLEAPHIEKNKTGKAVMINQAGWGGMLLGRIDVYFERNKKSRCVSCRNLPIGALKSND